MSNLFHNVLGTVLLDVSLGHHYRPEQLVLGSLVAHLSGHLLSGDPRVMGRVGGVRSKGQRTDGAFPVVILLAWLRWNACPM